MNQLEHFFTWMVALTTCVKDGADAFLFFMRWERSDLLVGKLFETIRAKCRDVSWLEALTDGVDEGHDADIVLHLCKL
jgi:hypothetical protein